MWLMPSFGRPDALHRLLGAPGGWPDAVYVLVNRDDLQLLRYEQAIDGFGVTGDRHPWRLLIVPQGSRFADAVRFAYLEHPEEPFYGIVDDDYWPVTPRWHERMVEAAGAHYVALANNKQNFPAPWCCRVMGGALARAIGTIAPGKMRHNFSDDTWGRFAKDFDLLRPLEDVIVEHRHHWYDKSVPNDATYERGTGHDFDADRALYEEWLDSDERKAQCQRVAAMLGIGVRTMDLRKVHLAICTPMQDMRVDVAYFVSYTHSMLDLAKSGVKYTTYPTFGGSHIGKAREHVLWRAMANPEITHLLFLDDDMGWDAHLPARLIMADHDFCAAVGVRKKEDIAPEDKFCFNPLPGHARFHDVTRFLEVRDVGFAFVMLKRKVIERMIEAYPELRYNAKEEAQYALFLDMIDKRDGEFGERLSEDFSFCRRWRDIGGEIWVDPAANLTHAGRKEYTGAVRETFRAVESAA